MTYRTRRLLSVLILLIGLPVWIVLSVTLVSMLDRPHIVVEVAIYVTLGIAWALPFRAVFRGIGKSDPDAPPRDGG